MKHYVAAIDGIPGILPGTVQVPPPPQEIEDPQPAPRSKKSKYRAREEKNNPRYKIRMMPCNKEGAKLTFTNQKQNLKSGSVFFLLHSILKIIILLLVYKLISKLGTE